MILKIDFIYLIFVHVHENVYAPCVGKCPQKPEEGIAFPGTGVTSGCKLPNIGARN